MSEVRNFNTLPAWVRGRDTNEGGGVGRCEEKSGYAHRDWRCVEGKIAVRQGAGKERQGRARDWSHPRFGGVLFEAVLCINRKQLFNIISASKGHVCGKVGKTIWRKDQTLTS